MFRRAIWLLALSGGSCTPAPTPVTTAPVVTVPAHASTTEPEPEAEPEPEPPRMYRCSEELTRESASHRAYFGQQAAPPVKVEADRIRLPGPVVFEPKTAELAAESQLVLMIIQGYLQAKPVVTALRIEAHTAGVGDAAEHLELSRRRAMTVACALVKQGIDCGRLVPVGFGDQQPLVSPVSEDDRAQNRRVAFVVAARDGTPAMKQPLDGGGQVAGDPCLP